MRELLAMGEARLDEHWSHTSSVLALIANVHRDPKKTGPFKPSDFSPNKRKQPVKGTADIGMLKDVFIRQDQTARVQTPDRTQESTG